MMSVGNSDAMGIPKAREVLGSQYAGSFIKFFENLRSSDFDYIVLLSRRCFVLYRLFSRLMGEGGTPEGPQPRVITDKAIALLPPRKELQGKNCLIVDDILIHGRAVSRVYNSLNGMFSMLRIYVYSKSVECYKGLQDNVRVGLLADTYSERTDTTSGWKQLSERLVTLIHLYNEPYTSFLMSMRTSGCPDITAFAGKLDAGVPGWEMHRRRYDQENASGVVVMFQGQMPGFFAKYCEQACMRIYCRSDTGSLCITPTAFPKTIAAKDMDPFMLALAYDLPGSMVTIKTLLGGVAASCTGEANDRTQAFNDLRYRLAAAVLSALYGAYALPSLHYAGLDIPALEYDLAPLRYSFSPEVEECVHAQLYEDNSWLTGQPVEFSKPLDVVPPQETPELVASLQSCLDTRDDVGDEAWDGLLHYFFLNGLKDERAVSRHMNICRDIGLSTPNILKKAQDVGLSKNATYADIIATWDTGRASMDALMHQPVGGMGYYSTFNCAGERSYRTVNECLGYHMVNMQRIEVLMLCWYGDGDRDSYQAALGKALKGYCEQARDHFSWTEAVWATVEQFIDFLADEKVPVSDYALESWDGDGADVDIAGFGECFMEQLLAQGV